MGKKITDLQEVINKLDYTINETEERKELVESLLSGDVDSFLVKYFDDFYNVNLNQNSKTSEFDKVCRQLGIISNYLVFQHEKEEKEKIKKHNEENDEKEEVSNQLVTGSKERRNRSREIKTDKVSLVEYGKSVEKNVKKYKVSQDTEITKDDLIRFPEINEIEKSREKLKVMIDSKNDLSQADKSKAKKMFKELKGEQKIIKEMLSGVFYFKDIIKFSDKKYDYGVINFSDKNHVKLMIDNFHSLYSQSEFDTHTDEKILCMFFDDLINKAWRNDYIDDKEISVLKDKVFQDMSNNEIGECNLLSKQHISRMLNSYIPSKIAKYYKDSFEDWLYTFIVKGSYKKCNSCSKNKIASETNFGRNLRVKDGLNSQCKTCSY